MMTIRTSQQLYETMVRDAVLTQALTKVAGTTCMIRVEDEPTEITVTRKTVSLGTSGTTWVLRV